MKKRLTGWIIYPRTKCSMTPSSYQWIVQQAALEGVELEVLFIEDLTCVVGAGGLELLNCGKKLSYIPNFALVRGYDFPLMRHIELMGIKLFNSCDGMRNSLDKFATHQILAIRGIPTPPTLYNCWDYEVNVHLFEDSRVVVKYPKGSRGEEVFLVDNRGDFEAVVSRFDEIITQKYVECSAGRDIRVWVVGDKAVDAVMRYNDSSFKSNFSCGGSVERVDITPEIEKIAVESSRALGLDFSGVDLLYDREGYLVCEVNGNAAFRSIATLTPDVEIPRKLFRYFGNYPFK